MNGYIVSAANKISNSKGNIMETAWAEDVERPTKKPGFIKRQLLKLLKVDKEQNAINLKERIRPMAIERHSLDSQPMHLKIYRANGGTIVETTTYDRQKDRHGNQLHIISHDTDLGEGLSKIITMESLRG
jgi:hypothetical protein